MLSERMRSWFEDGVTPFESQIHAWADEVAALEARLSKMEEVQEAAANWDRAHPNPEGHCDNDDVRMCVTARALKEALAGESDAE